MMIAEVQSTEASSAIRAGPGTQAQGI